MTDFSHIRAVIFDKDGTLFDFRASWSDATDSLLAQLSGGDPVLALTLAQAILYDPVRGGFDPSSPLIAGTLDDALGLLGPHLPDMSRTRLAALMHQSAAEAQMIAPLPLAPLLDALRATGRELSVATNDSEAAAHLHLKRAGILDAFAHVLGFDSGYTPKPAPDMLLELADRAALAPAQVMMVGDSTHDLIAGRAAGMVTIGVLTGLADRDTLSPHADLVLPDIGHLRAWLGAG